MKKIFWTTKDSKKIDIDKMSTEHLRNVLKMIIKNKSKKEIIIYDEYHQYNNNEVEKIYNTDNSNNFEDFWK